MPPDGGDVLFDGRPVADLRAALLADIESRAAVLTPESREHIPEALFLYGVFSDYDLSVPTLDFDRVFSEDVVVDGVRYLEIHVPMVGEPAPLELAPDGAELSEFYRDAFEYEIVDGDLCCRVELSGNDPEAIDAVTDEVLSALESHYEELRRAMERLESDAEAAARSQYQRQTTRGAWSASR